MITKEIASKFDAQDRPIDAVKAYEKAITEQDADLETFLNLAVLYFMCTDYGYIAHHKLSNEFVEKAWKRANEVLKEAESKFGKQAEIDFWRYYFRFVVLGDKPFIEIAENLSRSSLVPYFYLFTSPRGERYRQKAQQLLELVRDGTTAKKRYIKSILEGKLTSGSTK